MSIYVLILWYCSTFWSAGVVNVNTDKAWLSWFPLCLLTQEYELCSTTERSKQSSSLETSDVGVTGHVYWIRIWMTIKKGALFCIQNATKLWRCLSSSYRNNFYLGSDSRRGWYGCIYPRDAGKNFYILTQYNSI